MGIVDSIGEWLSQKLGFAGEDEATFLGGSPNCVGPSEDDVDEVARWLRDGPAKGLVIVASHAPVINIHGTEYPYYLRETQRRHQPDQVEAFLTELMIEIFEDKDVREEHPTWFGPDGSSEVDFVKRGNYDDLLDHGVSKGAAKRLLHVLVGVDLPKPADLVLTGHTHRDNEFVVRRLPGGEPAMFHDYYTENPGSYYPSAFATSFGDHPEFERTWVTVQAGADPGGTPVPTPGLDLPHEVAVPPYADPLNTSADPVSWWDSHRPLVLQTAALGPISVMRELRRLPRRRGRRRRHRPHLPGAHRAARAERLDAGLGVGARPDRRQRSLRDAVARRLRGRHLARRPGQRGGGRPADRALPAQPGR